MTKGSDGVYYYEVPSEFVKGNVIFSDGSDGSKEGSQIPAQGETGMKMNGVSHKWDGSKWIESVSVTPTPTATATPKPTATAAPRATAAPTCTPTAKPTVSAKKLTFSSFKASKSKVVKSKKVVLKASAKAGTGTVKNKFYYKKKGSSKKVVIRKYKTTKKVTWRVQIGRAHV